MEPKYSFDELLCQSLLLFRQDRMYGDVPECREKASLMLGEARHLINESMDTICIAKWGCVIETLAQKYYINNETDAVLEGMDVFLISQWKKAEHSDIEVFSFYLWIGYYFLLRSRNSQTHFRARSRRIMCDIVSCITEIFRKFKNKAVPTEILSLFPTDVWGETVYWAELVHDTRICEKQSAHLLAQLYNLKKVELQQSEPGQNVLLQQILEFYCF